MAEENLTKICSKCQIEKNNDEFYNNKFSKDGLRANCIDCGKKYNQSNAKKISKQRKLRNQINKITIAAGQKKYYKENKIKINAACSDYRKKNKGKIAILGKAFRENNKEKVALWMNIYYQANKKELKQKRKDNAEQITLYKRLYRQTDQCKKLTRIYSHKRRALKYNNIYEVFDPKEVFERDGYICQLCGCKTRPDYKNPNHSLYPTLDHIVPLSKGGGHTRLNTQCACRQCNMEKHNKIIGQLRLFG